MNKYWQTKKKWWINIMLLIKAYLIMSLFEVVCLSWSLLKVLQDFILLMALTFSLICVQKPANKADSISVELLKLKLRQNRTQHVQAGELLKPFFGTISSATPSCDIFHSSGHLLSVFYSLIRGRLWWHSTLSLIVIGLE